MLVCVVLMGLVLVDFTAHKHSIGHKAKETFGSVDRESKWYETNVGMNVGFSYFHVRANTNGVFVIFVTFYELLVSSSPVAVVGDRYDKQGLQGLNPNPGDDKGTSTRKPWKHIRVHKIINLPFFQSSSCFTGRTY